MLETELRQKGAEFSQAGNWEAHVVADGNLITGQNPASTLGVAKAVTAYEWKA
jgi:putative intracellular protease/amidase